MTTEQLALVFEEWKRRYDADPNLFDSCEAFEKEPPKSYGDGAARYFEFLIDELTADGVK